ncbi:MAG: hemerythrin [Desulfovibrionales bacterium]|jgi:hemerythrin-like metal-binding protein|nr:hemerythrin [Desulfovibrionales bacterium]
MPIVHWDGSQAIGIEIIDRQHQRLYEVLNSLDRKLHAPTPDATSLNTTVDSMHQYVRYHFSTEERLLEHYGWPGLQEHKLLHQTFVDKAEELLRLGETDVLQALREALVFLVSWVVNHIEGEDQKYAPFLREKVEQSKAK